MSRRPRARRGLGRHPQSSGPISLKTPVLEHRNRSVSAAEAQHLGVVGVQLDAREWPADVRAER